MSWVHQVPPKPPAKGQTRAEGFRLETGFRAVERTEFDKYVRICHYNLHSIIFSESSHIWCSLLYNVFFETLCRLLSGS